MVPSVPTASVSVLHAVAVVAAVVVLLGVATRLARAYRDRGKPGRADVPRLEQAQEAVITLAVVGLAVGALVDSGVADAALVVGVFSAVALGVVRWRRGERPFPSGL